MEITFLTHAPIELDVIGYSISLHMCRGIICLSTCLVAYSISICYYQHALLLGDQESSTRRVAGRCTTTEMIATQIHHH
jgi:hypothetical protein